MNCIVCEVSNFIFLYKNALKKCKACGFVTANIEIGTDELKKIYTENYFKGEEYLDYLKDRRALQFNFRSRLQQIQSHVQDIKFKNILEIGCAYGFFAQILKDKYPASKYIGLDVVEEPILYGKEVLGQNLVKDDYLTHSSTNKYTDVFMWDVVEHLQRPDLFFKKIYSELEDEGFVYITTGDIDALLPRIQRHKWRMIHPPSHLHYFSKNTLTAMLKKEGFEVKFIKYPFVYRSIKQIFYSLFILKKHNNSLLKKIFDLIPERWLIPLNTFDIMFVCAQKSINVK